jgi:hypothetical protein
MNITLSPAAELRLHKRAEKERRTRDEVAASILEEALLREPETQEEIVASLHRARQEFEEGRSSSWEDVDARLRQTYGLAEHKAGSVSIREIAPGVIQMDE